MTKLSKCFLFASVSANPSYQTEQISDQYPQISNQTQQISHQYPQISNQGAQISNQQPQISNQQPQTTNQQPQISYQECKTIARTTCNFSDGNGENGFGTVQGTLSITEYRDCPDNAFETVYSGKLSGSSTNFVQGLHGLHVHQGYELSSCGALGGHFTVNPSAIHGRPFWEEPERHAGDLGNVMCNSDRTIDVLIRDRVTSLKRSSLYDIGGRGMVLHAMEDDFNPERSTSSTGMAGARVGCCLIDPNVQVVTRQ